MDGKTLSAIDTQIGHAESEFLRIVSRGLYSHRPTWRDRLKWRSFGLWVRVSRRWWWYNLWVSVSRIARLTWPTKSDSRGARPK